jgi:choline dehydrogenase-like flavoprotein
VNVDNKKATGIETERFGRHLSLRAKREVILSAGTVGSPQILLLSGVGPKEHLEEVGVEVKQELLGVGENLQDHVAATFWVSSENDRTFGANVFDIANPVAYFDYLWSGKGPLVSIGVEIGAFLKSTQNWDPWNRSDIQIGTFPATFIADFGLKYKDAINFNDDLFFGAYNSFRGK